MGRYTIQLKILKLFRKGKIIENLKRECYYGWLGCGKFMATLGTDGNDCSKTWKMTVEDGAQ